MTLCVLLCAAVSLLLLWAGDDIPMPVATHAPRPLSAAEALQRADGTGRARGGQVAEIERVPPGSVPPTLPSSLWPLDGSEPTECLQVVMPTVARPRGIKYVEMTVQSIAREMATVPACAHVHVMDVHPGRLELNFNETALHLGNVHVTVHPVPGSLKVCEGIGHGQGFSGSDTGQDTNGHGEGAGEAPKRKRGAAKDPEHAAVGPVLGEPGCLASRATLDLPRSKRQQLMDFPRMLAAFEPECGKHGGDAAEPDLPYYLLMEDDFEWCPGFAKRDLLRVLAYVRHRDSEPKFRGLRIAVGLNGLIMRCADIPRMIEGVFFSAAKPPIDYLLGKLFADSGRLIHTFRYNTMHHIGSVSTVGNHASLYKNVRRGRSGPIPRCGELLTNHITMPPEEEFDLRQCCDQLYSPCGVLGTFEGGKFTFAKRSEATYVQLDTLRDSPLASGDGLIYATRGREYLSCDEVCLERGMICNPAGAYMVDTCEALKNAFECTDCHSFPADPLPGFEEYESPSFWARLHGRSGPGICAISQCTPLIFRCDSKHGSMRRLCPCARKKNLLEV
jgi:hypothetical protein